MNGKGGIYIKKLIADGALKEDFQIELLGTYPLEECLERETELAKTSLFPKGLNGNAGTFIVQTEETKAKISNTLKGREVSEETRQKLKGITRTDEFKRKVSEFHTGRNRSKETCLKIGEAHKGKIISEDARLKMSLAKLGVKGNPHSEETKQKIRQSNLGKKRSAETRNNIIISMLNNQNSFFGTEEGKQMAVERNKKLMETGRHPSQIKQTCPYCQKVVSKTNHTRWHGESCKMYSMEVKI